MGLASRDTTKNTGRPFVVPGSSPSTDPFQEPGDFSSAAASERSVVPGRGLICSQQAGDSDVPIVAHHPELSVLGLENSEPTNIEAVRGIPTESEHSKGCGQHASPSSQNNLSDELQHSRVEGQRLRAALGALQVERSNSDKRNHERLGDLEARNQCLNEQLDHVRNHQSFLVQELFTVRGSVWTVARIRPDPDAEQLGQILEMRKTHFKDQRSTELKITITENNARGLPQSRSMKFFFDHVFLPNSENSEVSQYVYPMVQAALDGADVVITVDGQSGTGKSHTLFTGEDAIATSAAEQIFCWTAFMDTKGSKCKVYISSFEIYQKKIQDLHQDCRQASSVRISVHHDRTELSNHVVRTVESTQDLKALLERASKKRHVGVTERNGASSRGHSITMLTFERPKSFEKSISRLFLVDLAGGERDTDSNKNSKQSMEGQAINSDRRVYRDCMVAMRQKKSLSCTRESQVHSILYAVFLVPLIL